MSLRPSAVMLAAVAAIAAGAIYWIARPAAKPARPRASSDTPYVIDFDDTRYDAELRQQVHVRWNDFAMKASLTADQQRELTGILADLQKRYLAHIREVNATMTQAMLTHDLDTVKARADGLHLGDYDRTVEAELRRRVQAVLDERQYELFRSDSLDDAVTLAWGAYGRGG